MPNRDGSCPSFDLNKSQSGMELDADSFVWCGDSFTVLIMIQAFSTAKVSGIGQEFYGSAFVLLKHRFSHLTNLLHLFGVSVTVKDNFKTS